MSVVKPWGVIDPNSQHQLWSRWTFFVAEHLRHPSKEVVEANFTRWLRKGFGTVGRACITEWDTVPDELRALAGREGVGLGVNRRGFSCLLEIEGAPAHDPDYAKSVWAEFRRFVEMGWGPDTYHRMTVKVLAGDLQDGRPRDQVLVMPLTPLLTPHERARLAAKRKKGTL